MICYTAISVLFADTWVVILVVASVQFDWLNDKLGSISFKVRMKVSHHLNLLALLTFPLSTKPTRVVGAAGIA